MTHDSDMPGGEIELTQEQTQSSLACASCGVAISPGHEIVLQRKGKNASPITICSNCSYELERAFATETQDSNLLGALLGGLGAAVLSSLIWYVVVVVTNYQLGIVAIAVGWLVAQGVMVGSGRKRGPQLQALSVAITLVAMLASEYFVLRHFIVEELSAQGYTDFKLLLPLGDMIELVIEGIKAEPITLLFWGIALWQAFVIPAQRQLRRAMV